jgi:uncharacterized protein
MKNNDFGLKASKYNIFVDIGKGRYILFNSMSKTVSVVTYDVKKRLQSDYYRTETGLADYMDEIKVLGEGGFLISSEKDELTEFRELHLNSKFDETSATFVIIPTFSCNLKCPYCYQGQGIQRPVGSMNEKTSKVVADFIVKYISQHKTKSLLIQIIGGEPLANFSPLEYILSSVHKYCTDSSIEVTIEIDTNGTLITDEIIEKIQKFSPTVVISLDGSKQFHNKHRFFNDGTGTFDRIIQNIELLIERNIVVEGNICVSKDNFSSMKELLMNLRSRGIVIPVNFIHLRERTGACSSFSSSCFMDTDWGKRILPLLLETARKENTRIASRPWAPYVFCNMQRKSGFVIDPLGYLYRCPVLAGHTNHIVGRIEPGGKCTFTNNNMRWLERDPTTFVECKECNLLPLCAGGCTQSAFRKTGTYNNPDCYLRTFIEADILDYARRNGVDIFEGNHHEFS